MMRSLLLAVGCLVLAAAWLLPLGDLLPGPFSTHMTIHMSVVAVAAPLIAAGVAGRAFDPVRAWPALFPAIAISMIELFVVWAWHAPALHHAARHSAGVLVLEQASFLVTGLWLWLAALGGGAAQRAGRGALGIVALLVTCMHMTLLGALLALPTRALYAGAASPASLTDVSALRDQHIGGAIMLAVGGVSYLVGGLWLAAGLLRRQPRPIVERRMDTESVLHAAEAP
jgi:putative membrane protein